jgi:hypothetical protein
MPLSQPLCYSPPYLWPAEVRRRAHAALYELVQETVVEAGEQGRREAMAGEQAVRRRFLCERSVRASEDGVGLGLGRGALTLAVYQNVGALSVGAQQNGIVVDFRLRAPWELVDCFQKLF